jgi:hypothetical protein
LHCHILAIIQGRRAGKRTGFAAAFERTLRAPLTLKKELI